MKVSYTTKFWQVKVIKEMHLRPKAVASGSEGGLVDFKVNELICVAGCKPMPDRHGVWNCIMVKQENVFIWGGDELTEYLKYTVDQDLDQRTLRNIVRNAKKIKK